MADAQLVAIAIAVLGGTLINTSRLGDMNNRLGDVNDVIRAEMHASEARMDNKFAAMDRKTGRVAPHRR